jgi:hypothetical protein
VGGDGELFNGGRVLVLEDEKNSMDGRCWRLCNVNVLTIIEAYT